MATMASNIHCVHLIRTVQRYSRVRRKEINVECPNSVSMCNKHIQRRNKQNGSEYECVQDWSPTEKWWWPLLTLSVDVSVQNAWFLHSEDSPNITRLDFRESIAHNSLTKNRVSPSWNRLHKNFGG